MVDVCINKQEILEASNVICNAYSKTCHEGKEEGQQEGFEKVMGIQSLDGMKIWLRFPDA